MMLVTIEGSKEVIDTNSLLDKRIDSGKDGDVYRLNDNEVIKLCNSCLMTEEKIKDLRECVTEAEERTTSRLVLPRKIVREVGTNPNNRLNIATGYTERYVKEKKHGIVIMSTDTFLQEITLLREDIHKHFSPNSVAIRDSNPNNLLPEIINSSERLCLIDHDRDVTVSSMYSEKSHIRNQDYVAYNNKRFSLLAYKALLLQILKLEGINSGNYGVVANYVESQAQREDVTQKTIETALLGYRYVSEYAQDAARKIKENKMR